MAVKEQTGSFEPKPFGRYVLIEKLAVGGMAEIYRAKTYGVDGFEKQLAIKRILPHCAADNEFIRMLVDEAKLTVLLSHANIVQVFDLGKVGDDYFISMEFINGTNLREVLIRQRDNGKKVPEELAVYIMSEVCKGLDYAHRKADSQGSPLNIVHRDISPQNVLLSFEGEVKIVDFGIAKAAMNVSHTMAGILKGKVAYMSPEQALGKPIDHRTDIFSAGVLLYEMMTGDKLFSGETQFEVLNQIRTTRINTMMLPDHISGPLKAILAKSLAYNVKDRYQSAGDFQLDLTKYLYSSYVDFSPRQLASLVLKLFAPEIKKKETPVTLDEKTRSVLLQADSENIVVHSTEPAPPTGNTQPAIPAVQADASLSDKPRESPPQNTSVSGLYAIPTEKKQMRSWVKLAAGVVLMVVVGYAGYNFVLKDLLNKKPTEVVSPTRPGGEEAGSEDIGSIDADTIPPGAQIFLNGNDTGLVTPAKVAKLTLGEEYQVKLFKENYTEASKTVVVTSEEPVKLQETLAPLPKGVIEVVSNPLGAKIAFNDQDTGLVTPFRIENLEIQKSYNVRLSYPSYNDWTGTVDLKDFEPLKLEAALTPVAPPVTTPPPTEPVAPPVAAEPPVTTTPTPLPTEPVAPPVVTPQPTPTPPTQVTTTPTPPPVQTPPETVTGRLSISSNPPGARILINGGSTGRVTPASLDKLEFGKRITISLSKKGYDDWSQSITVEGSKTMPLYASLKKEKEETPPPPVTTPPPVATTPPPVEPPAYTPPPPPRQPIASLPPEQPPAALGGKPGTLSVSSDPSGAEVYINSEFKGTTPVKVANIAPGTVRVSVSKEGYMRQTTSVKVGPGENKSVGSIKLGSMYGEISVNSMPPRATVIFDGDAIGARTPVTIRRVPRDKSHTLRVRLDGYREWESSVSLSDRETKKFDVQLEKQ